MCEHVVPEVVCPSKPLATLEAGEGALVCVGSLVDLQVVALGELPVAELANETLLWSRGPAGASKESRVVGGGRRVVGGGWQGGRGEGGGQGGVVTHQKRLRQGGQEALVRKKGGGGRGD